MSINMTQRDYELLRTLVRVQLATTSCFQGTFFSTAHLVSKRFSQLRNAGLIATHSKGLPQSYGVNRSRYWRITDAGVARLLERYPEERIPDNLVSRTSRASLLFHQHRDAMTACYMRLIASREANIEDMRARAQIVDWRGEYDVVLDYSQLVGVRHQAKKIVPDATLSTAHTRFFLEIDRSTEPSSRLRAILERYTSAFRQPSYTGLFPDALPPSVLYVTKSEARAKNISVLISELELPYAAYALNTPAAMDFLNDAINRQESAPPHARAKTQAESILGILYQACREHVTTSPQCHSSASALSPALEQAYAHLVTLQGTH
tara:strand:- start:110 stop:1072 length:963 start_codon:yes stop_codon:yes gene_type:complete